MLGMVASLSKLAISSIHPNKIKKVQVHTEENVLEYLTSFCAEFLIGLTEYCVKSQKKHLKTKFS